jgi:hypothetical protein
MGMTGDPSHAYDKGDDVEQSEDNDFVVSLLSSKCRHRPRPL